jgi:hypothetical protein
MKTIFVNEIEKDYGEYCFNKLKEIDVSYKFDTTEKVMFDYQRYKFRKINQMKRVVHTSSTFVCPSKYKEVFATIIKKIKQGESLLDYQSRLLKKVNYDDGLLMDWGVQHLHLGASMDNDGFIQRTGDLLFVRFVDGIAYIIGIFEHQQWATLEILETIHTNWPHSIKGFLIKGVTAISPCPDENSIGKFRKIGLNSVIKLQDGSLYVGPGGGITSAGTPLKSTRDTTHLRIVFKNAYNYISMNFDSICEDLQIENNQNKITIGLRLENGKLVYTLKEIGESIVL